MKLLKNKIFWLFLTSLVGTGVGYVFLYPIQFNLCVADFATNTFDTSCLTTASYFGNIFFYPSITLALIFLVLLFIPRAVSAWRRFAVWGILVGILLLFSWSPNPGTLIDLGPTLQELVMFLSAIYLGASLGIISISLINSKRKQKGTAPLSKLWYWVAAIGLSIISLYIFGPIINTVLSLVAPPLV